MTKRKLVLAKEEKEKHKRVLTNIIPNQLIIDVMRADRRAISFQLKDYPNINFNAGSENRRPLKACFLEITGTFETEEENKKLAINNVCKQISQTVYNTLDKKLFRDEFICTKDISDSFVYTGKSYTKLEYTFFLRREMDNNDLIKELNKISHAIWLNNIQDGPKMKFHKKLITRRKYEN